MTQHSLRHSSQGKEMLYETSERGGRKSGQKKLQVEVQPDHPLDSEPVRELERQQPRQVKVCSCSLAFVSSEALRLMIQLLPGCQQRFGQLFEKHCLPQTTLVFILCLLSGASSETEHPGKSASNAKEFILSDSSASLSKAIKAKNRHCLRPSAFLVMLKADSVLSGSDLSLRCLQIK